MEFIADFHANVQVDGESPHIDFRGTGYMFIADDEAAYERLEAESHGQLAMGAEVEMLRPAQIAERYPYMDADQLVGARVGGLREGSFDGWALFQGVRQRAVHNGVTYIRDRVVGLDVVGSRVQTCPSRIRSQRRMRLCDQRGRVSREQVAAMAGLALPVEPRARTSFVFDCRTPIDEIVPLTVTPFGVHFRREQHHYMCGTVPRDDVAVDPDDFEIRHAEFDEQIWPVLEKYVPRFDQVGVVTSWGGQYDYNTLDHNLIIGAGSQVENFLFANGHSGHGLQQGPAVGRALSELITLGTFRTIDLTPFGYSRIERNEPIVEHAVI